MQRDAVLLDAAQDLRAVDLAQHDVPAAHPGERVGHAPPVAVEHRQRVEVHVAVGHAGVPAERRRVEPHVAVRELHTLRTGRGATRVVDGGGGVLVGVPRPRLDAEAQQLVVAVGADHEAVRRLHVGERVVELGVDEQHRRARVLDDVRDLLRR